MSKDEIFDKLKNILVNEFELDAGDVTPDALLGDDLDLDSIDSIDLIVKNLSCNDNLSLASPLIQFFRYPNQFKYQFENQRSNNFSNWIETSPLSYSDFVVIKRKYFSKIGHFDYRFKTLDYAIFDFVLRLYQINSYYCTMKDIVVFKSANVSKNISLFKQDKLYLYKKWDENLILKLLKYSE